MDKAGRNGLLVGLAIGLYSAWSNWPADAVISDARLVRAVGQVIGATAIGWYIGYLIGQKTRI